MSIGVIVANIFAVLAIAICTVGGIINSCVNNELAESKEEQTEQIVTVGEFRARTVQIDTIITYSSLTGACDTTYIVDTTTCK